MWFWVLALLLFASLIGGLLYGAYRNRRRHFSEIERMRNRIASDLHDGVGGKMSSIALLIDVVSRSSSLREEERMRLRETAREARQVVDDLRDAVWLIDSGRDELSDLVLRMEKTARQMLRGIAHHVTLPNLATVPHATLEMDTRRHILMVFKEALHNALQHSDASHVNVRIDVQSGNLTFEVTDDGQGFDEAAVEAGHGLSSMRKRASAVDARLEIASQPSEGTMIRFAAPVV